MESEDESRRKASSTSMKFNFLKTRSMEKKTIREEVALKWNWYRTVLLAFQILGLFPMKTNFRGKLQFSSWLFCYCLLVRLFTLFSFFSTYSFKDEESYNSTSSIISLVGFHSSLLGFSCVGWEIILRHRYIGQMFHRINALCSSMGHRTFPSHALDNIQALAWVIGSGCCAIIVYYYIVSFSGNIGLSICAGFFYIMAILQPAYIILLARLLFRDLAEAIEFASSNLENSTKTPEFDIQESTSYQQKYENVSTVY